MTSKEILKEFESDYLNWISKKIMGIATDKSHEIKKLKKGRWLCLPEFTVNAQTGNTYKVVCKIKWDKRRGFCWGTTSYLDIPDSRTGKRVIYIIAENFPLKLSSSFIKELGMDISEFIWKKTRWEIITCESGNSRYTDYVEFGNDLGAGVGGYENGVLVLRHIQKTWEINPIVDFLKSREVSDEEITIDAYKSDIDKAWESYLCGEFDE